MLNLVDAVIREQGSLPPQERRRGALVVVDEMQSMPGVDYESPCYRSLASSAPVSFSPPRAWPSWRTCPAPCATPSSPTWVAWPSSRWRAADARQLVWELGKDRVSEDDIVSLPVHQCYVRATVGTERMDAFSMAVKKPEAGDPERAERIRAAASSYVTGAKEIAAGNAEADRKVGDFHEGVNDLKDGQAKTETQDPDKPPKKHKGRSRNPKPPKDDSGGEESS